MTSSVYAVIIGSGVAGSLIAQKLIETGKGKVLMLEAGPDIKMGDPGWWFQYVGTGNAPYKATYDEPSDFTSTGVDQWYIVGGRVQGRGGTTNHWGGWCPRNMPEDFQLYSNTGEGIDWPYDYTDLEPYYLQAEDYLGVEGDSSEQNPQRSGDYPFAQAAYPISAQPYISAFEKMNITYRHLPMARYGKGGGKFGGTCRTTGTCDYCPVSGRFTGDQPLDAISDSQFELLLNAPVETINMSSKTTASGVTYLDNTTGTSITVDAQIVIVAAGAFETPKLLQRSTSSYWTNGIGNDNDLVGRFLVANQFFFTTGTMASNPKQFEEELGFENLCSRYFDSPATQAEGKLFLTMDYGAPTTDIADLMFQGKTAADIQAATSGAVQWQLWGNLSGVSEYDNRISNEAGTTRYGLPKTLISTPKPVYNASTMDKYKTLCEQILTSMGCSGVQSGSYPQRGDHAACTTRMATDPSVGVVDTSLKVHGTDNVYVFGNSVLPTLAAANPTLTMVAMIFKSLNEFSDILSRDC